MEMNEEKQIVFRRRFWSDYIYKYSEEDAHKMGEQELDELDLSSEKYKNYIREEVAERMIRHNTVLSLIGISEKPNLKSSTAVDFFEGDKYIGTCETPKKDCYIKDDATPFKRSVKLSKGSSLKIEDDFSSKFSEENRFYTKLNLDEENEGVYIKYGVDSFNKPISLVISYNGVYLRLTNSSGEFSYSASKRTREVSFSMPKGISDKAQNADYLEKIDARDDSLTGRINVEDRYSLEDLYDTRDHENPYVFVGGIGKECPKIPLPTTWAQCYSTAIATHKRSKELIQFVLEVLYKRFPRLEQFILERFPNIIKFINADSLSIPEIDEVFEQITNSFPNTIFTLGRDGFMFKNPVELEELIKKNEYRYTKKGRWEEKHADKIELKKRKDQLKKEYLTTHK